MAAGPLEIYRVPGSVSFLHSGALLHAIMPRSQCWCVDGVSKFAFRVLQDTYYRIELPGKTAEELELVEGLKLTLKKVLFYERTPCPFARTFTVELPEEGAKIKKSRRRSSGPAKKWRLQRAYSWKPEDGSEPERRGSTDSSISGSAHVTDEEGAEESSSEDQQEGESDELVDQVKGLDVATPHKPTRLSNLRSVTAPPQLTMNSTPASKSRSNTSLEPPAEVDEPAEEQVEAGAQQRHSVRFESIPTDMPPSPPDSSAGQEYVDPRTSTRTDDRARQDISQRREEANFAKEDERAWTGNEDETDAPRKATDSVESTLSEQTNDEMEAFEEEIGENRVDATNDAQAAKHANELAYTSNQNSSTTLGAAAHVADPQEAQQSDSAPSTQSEPRNLPDTSDHAPSTPPRPTPSATITSAPDDPYARIHAHIRARQSIGSPTTLCAPQTRRYSSSSSSSSNSTTTTRPRALPPKPPLFPSPSILVRKACAVFLGPPAGLVALMLRIAARVGRFGNGVGDVAGGVWSTGGGGKVHVPGSFDLGDELSLGDGGGEEVVDEEEEEDDFGVPLRSPVRRAKAAAGVGGFERNWDDGRRRGWERDVDSD